MAKTCLNKTIFSLIINIFVLSVVTASTVTTDIELLLTRVKPSLQGEGSNALLSYWNTSIPLCQWRGLKFVYTNGTPLVCTDTALSQWSNVTLFKDPNIRLLSLQLPSANISGQLPAELGDFAYLQSLYLSVNSISGSIPFEIGYSNSLLDIDLGYNLLSGSVPGSVWNLCEKLVSIRVHGNLLSGSIPKPGLPNVSCEGLVYVDFGQNKFSGNFPEFLTGFKGIKELDLSGNGFYGEIPNGLVNLNLEKLNLSYNNFSGVLPNFVGAKFGLESFEGNGVGLCGGPLKGCDNNRANGGLSSGAVAGLVISLMTGIVVLASLLIGYSQGKKKKNLDEEDEYDEGEDEENGGAGGGGAGEGKLILFQGGEHLTLEDVLNATGQVMEKTSYGTIYKAKLADGGTIALRLLREGSCKEGGLCLPAIKQLGRIRHESLIPLRAFYQGKRGEKLLIYDYLPNRTLHELLHETRPGKPVLNWARRHKIALAIAKGLAHLHSTIETPVTHGNIRSRNVLVDDFFVARLTDFGLYKLMIPAVADEIIAAAKADGYKAPELQKMKNCNSRTDVYAFGILLLEILLGKKPGKTGNRDAFVDLPAVVKVAVLEETTMEVFDVEVLKGIRSPMEDGVVQALKLAMGCCAPVASVRPSMEEVVKQLEENRPRNRSALYSPAETRSGLDTPF
uniref:putative kinase-like protein TMKL1 n=1 Tax=Erigeron canadensis TaxID=72917 RepID=UPI001CB966A6|nr:putative kinase-like protein TMKL1 [Erigeron canadensis]